MKRKIVMLFLIILTIPLLFILAACPNIKTSTCGDFSYTIIKKNKEKMAAIVCLSKEGLEKEVIIIPEYLDGYKVYGLYDRGISTQRGRIHSTNLDRLYILSDIKLQRRVCSRKIFYLFSWTKTYLGNGFTEEYYSSTVNLDDYEKVWDHNVFNANVTYYNNYGDNDIYWIDDYDNELITYIPENPTRDNYTFDGWYKDAECTISWKFENDIVPSKEYDSDNNYVYKETKLYAKWI